MRTTHLIAAAVTILALSSTDAAAKFPPRDSRVLLLGDYSLSLDGASTGSNGVNRWASFNNYTDLGPGESGRDTRLPNRYRRRDRGAWTTYRARTAPRVWHIGRGVKGRARAVFRGDELRKLRLRIKVGDEYTGYWPLPGLWTEDDVTEVIVTPGG